MNKLSTLKEKTKPSVVIKPKTAGLGFTAWFTWLIF